MNYLTAIPCFSSDLCFRARLLGGSGPRDYTIKTTSGRSEDWWLLFLDEYHYLGCYCRKKLEPEKEETISISGMAGRGTKLLRRKLYIFRRQGITSSTSISHVFMHNISGTLSFNGSARVTFVASSPVWPVQSHSGRQRTAILPTAGQMSMYWSHGTIISKVSSYLLRDSHFLLAYEPRSWWQLSEKFSQGLHVRILWVAPHGINQFGVEAVMVSLHSY
jgi:hypothetical protein